MSTLPRRRFLGTALAALAAGEGAAAAPVGVLRRAVSTEISSMDPQRPTGQLTSELAAELFTGLTSYDRGGRLAPGCATSWEAAPDGLAWTFRLREGLEWSDGRPLDARDFVFTLRRYLAPETGAAQASRLDSIRGARDLRHGRAGPEVLGVGAPDARTLRIELEHPDVELPTMLGAAYCVPGHVIAARGREWSRPESIVCNGAYALERWVPGAKRIELRRNPRHHDAASVRIERVHWLTGHDDATRLRLYRLGEVEVSTIEDAGNLGIARRELAAALHASPEAAVGWIGLNVGRGRLADPRLRRALSLAIDRRIITDRVRGLGEQPSDALLPPGLPAHATPAMPDYADWPMPRRIAAARDLLRQAGIAAGSMPPLVVGFPASPTARKLFLAVAAMWKSVGIPAELRPMDGRAYVAALDAGQFDAFSYSSFAQVPTATVFLDRFHSQSSINFVRWRNPEFDRLFTAAGRQPTLAQRVAGLAAAERVVLRELPVIPLWVGASNRLVSPRVSGWVDHPGQLHPSQYLALR
ncbi:MAG: peptide ABC transporter substrate-binding protein [Steroidobacteraceae bacterium]|jgi:oligopeptide transport system substrate-binding protein|nr:peptide ABC transporter substrate-binding protein [Steroidobacteraceae bacterium]